MGCESYSELERTSTGLMKTAARLRIGRTKGGRSANAMINELLSEELVA